MLWMFVADFSIVGIVRPPTKANNLCILRRSALCASARGLLLLIRPNHSAYRSVCREVVRCCYVDSRGASIERDFTKFSLQEHHRLYVGGY
jgi:hypothetical protein